MEIDAKLCERDACEASRLKFVSPKFLHGKPCKSAGDAAVRCGEIVDSNSVLSPLELMTETRVRCSKNCLGGNGIGGVDATEYWMK